MNKKGSRIDPHGTQNKNSDHELSYQELCLTSHLAFWIPSVFTLCFTLWFYFLLACNFAFYFASWRAFYHTLSRSCLPSYFASCLVAFFPGITFNLSSPFILHNYFLASCSAFYSKSQVRITMTFGLSQYFCWRNKCSKGC